MISIHGVSKFFGRRAALDGVSLTFEPGEVILLLGANGAGKSTLLRCLLGITDFEGTIRVNGLDPLKNGRDVRALIGYMPQAGGLHPDLTAEETLRFYAEIRQAPLARVPLLLREAGLADHAATRVGDLSGGMRQRLGFAVALLTDPADSRPRRAERESRRGQPRLALAPARTGGGRGTHGDRFDTRGPRNGWRVPQRSRWRKVA